MTIDLNTLSLAELKQLQKDLAKAISDFEARRKAEARSALDAQAKEFGFTLAELMDGAPAKKGSKTPPKYRHPENPALTWTGRGRNPKWVVEHLAAGKMLEDLEI